VRHCRSTASVPPVVGSRDSDRPDVAWWGRSASPPVWMRGSRPGTERRGYTTGSREGATPLVWEAVRAQGCADFGVCAVGRAMWCVPLACLWLGCVRWFGKACVLGCASGLGRAVGWRWLGAIAVALALLWLECAVGLRKGRPWLGEGRAVTRSRASVHCPRSGRCAAELGMAPFRRCVLGRGGCCGFGREETWRRASVEWATGAREPFGCLR
jgi:hypothetical protein